MRPGEEQNCGTLSALCGCTRAQIIDAADDLCDHDFHLHVADGLNGQAFERPKKAWTLFRDHDA